MNIILIGMPGCGKSTIGVLLAKTLLLDFVDTDLAIQKQYSKSLCEIIDENGLEEFKRIENDVICSLRFNNCVVATGGSAVYGDGAMQHLKAKSKIVYLKLQPNEIKHRIKNIKTRGIAMKKGCTIEDLYTERAPLYEKYADYIIDCKDKTVEQCVDLVVSALENNILNEV